MNHDLTLNASCTLSRRDNVINFPGCRRPFTTDLRREPIARSGRKSRIEFVGDKFGTGDQDDWVIMEVLTLRRNLAVVSAAVWPLIE